MTRGRPIDAADRFIVDRPGIVVVGFLLLTLVFLYGLTNLTIEAGTGPIIEGTAANEEFEAINDEFDEPFERDTGSTILIQSDLNVLEQDALLRMLHTLEGLDNREELRIERTSSAAVIVAQTLEPDATTLDKQIRAVERATPSQIDRAVRQAAEADPQFEPLLSEDFDANSATASATVVIVEHELSTEIGAAFLGGGEGSGQLTPLQRQSEWVAEASGGDIRVLGAGITDEEFTNVVFDSLVLTVPAAVLLVLLFLVVAYRDLLDLLLGAVGLAMVLVWTFGFLGLIGLSFTVALVSVPVLMLAIGIDFSIHAINRYREERVAGHEVAPAMRRTTDQLLVAFFIVTVTSVIGFGSNLTSSLSPVRDFGLTTAAGIVFTFLIFGVFLTSAKVGLDRLRSRFGSQTTKAPMGAEGSRIGRVLSSGTVLATRAPLALLVVVVVASAGSAVYATGLETSFSQEEFLPPAEEPAYYDDLPEPFRPSEYTVTRNLEYVEGHFESGPGDTVTIYVERPMEADSALEELHRAGENPPETFVRDDHRAREQSLVTVIQSYAARDPQFRDLVDRNDVDQNGVPDQNLGEIYDALLASPAGDDALEYLSQDRRSTRVVYSVEADADDAEIAAEAYEFADRFRYESTATGNIIVFQGVADDIFTSTFNSLGVALVGAAIFLVLVYWRLEGRPSLGLANVAPIVVITVFVAGTMRAFDLQLNTLTAAVLSIAVGLGIDYSVHVVHRFVDEYDEIGDPVEALDRTIVGTGGALTGSMLTTVTGVSVLVFALMPAIGQFALITALSVFYSYLASIWILPSVLVVWARYDGRRARKVEDVKRQESRCPEP